MNKYDYLVYLNEGNVACSGTIAVYADNPDDAYNKACDSFVNRWIVAYPELDVDYNVELESVEIDKDELKRKLEKAKMYIPYDEELEIFFNEKDYMYYTYRYKKSRGSAIPIDGCEEPLISWFDLNDYNKDFDFKEFVESEVGYPVFWSEK